MKRFFFKSANALAVLTGMGVLLYGLWVGKAWRWWSWEDFQKVGNREVVEDRQVGSLEELFANRGEELRAAEGAVVIWGDEDDGPHGWDFLFRGKVDWFLAPGNRGAEIVYAERPGVRWVFSDDDCRAEVEPGFGEVEEVWKKDGVWLFKVEPRLEDIRHKTEEVGR